MAIKLPDRPVPTLPRESGEAVRPRRRAGPRVVPLASRRKRGTRSGAGPEDSGAATGMVSRGASLEIPARFAKFYLVLRIGYHSTQVLYAGRDPAAAWKVRNVAEREREAVIKSTWFRMSQNGTEEVLLP